MLPSVLNSLCLFDNLTNRLATTSLSTSSGLTLMSHVSLSLSFSLLSVGEKRSSYWRSVPESKERQGYKRPIYLKVMLFARISCRGDIFASQK